MTKLRITNLKQVQTSIRKEVIKAIRDKNTLKEVGEVVVEEIRNNPMGKAGETTRAFRQFFEQFNKTHQKYKRSDINITFTGELLNDLKKNILGRFGQSKAEYVIEHSNKNHENYKSGGAFKDKKVEVTSLKTRKTRKVTQKKSYKYISKQIIKKGYDYFNLSKRSETRVLEVVKKAILKRIKNLR